MNAVTHESIQRLFPGIEDHAVLELLAAGGTWDELEAAAMLLADQDEGIVEMQHKSGDRVAHLAGILKRAQVGPADVVRD